MNFILHLTYKSHYPHYSPWRFHILHPKILGAGIGTWVTAVCFSLDFFGGSRDSTPVVVHEVAVLDLLDFYRSTQVDLSKSQSNHHSPVSYEAGDNSCPLKEMRPPAPYHLPGYIYKQGQVNH